VSSTSANNLDPEIQKYMEKTCVTKKSRPAAQSFLAPQSKPIDSSRSGKKAKKAKKSKS